MAPTPSACPPQSRGGCLGACALLWASGPWWGGNTVVAPPGDTHLGQQRGAGSGIILGCRPHPLLPPHGTASLPPPPHTGGAHRRMEGGKPTACPMCPPCPPCVPHPARLPPCMCTPLHAPPRTASRELQPVFVAPRNTRRVLNRAPPPPRAIAGPPLPGIPGPPQFGSGLNPHLSAPACFQRRDRDPWGHPARDPRGDMGLLGGQGCPLPPPISPPLPIGCCSVPPCCHQTCHCTAPPYPMMPAGGCPRAQRSDEDARGDTPPPRPLVSPPPCPCPPHTGQRPR